MTEGFTDMFWILCHIKRTFFLTAPGGNIDEQLLDTEAVRPRDKSFLASSSVGVMVLDQAQVEAELDPSEKM